MMIGCPKTVGPPSHPTLHRTPRWRCDDETPQMWGWNDSKQNSYTMLASNSRFWYVLIYYRFYLPCVFPLFPHRFILPSRREERGSRRDWRLVRCTKATQKKTHVNGCKQQYRTYWSLKKYEWVGQNIQNLILNRQKKSKNARRTNLTLRLRYRWHIQTFCQNMSKSYQMSKSPPTRPTHFAPQSANRIEFLWLLKSKNNGEPRPSKV